MASPITLCGSLSLHPVTLGADMHEAGYRALGLPFRYVPFAATEGSLAGALTGMRALEIRGFGVSMPFKSSIGSLLDELDPTAARIGAVNTVVNESGRLVGHNTDAEGAVRALGEHVDLSTARVLVVGAGGAARAVIHGLLGRGSRVRVANRTHDRAVALAAELQGIDETVDVAPWPLTALPEDVLVNASSLGMTDYDASSPLPKALLEARHTVMDIVYKPLRTRLLEDAAEVGAVGIHGGRMLLHQASRQFELYTGRPAPLPAMSAALERHLT